MPRRSFRGDFECYGDFATSITSDRLSPMSTSVEDTPQTQKINSLALKVALCASGAVILVSLFRWTIVEYLTPFLEPFLEMAIAGFFVIALVWSIVHSIRSRGHGRRTALLPVFVCLLTATAAIFVPFNALMTDLNFRVHYAARMKVVTDVLQGMYDSHIENSGGRGDWIALPASRSYLSSGGGDIVRFRHQDRTLILFFSFRGVLDSFSGFVYSTDNMPPTDGDFGGQFVEVIPLRKNWFWAASRN